MMGRDHAHADEADMGLAFKLRAYSSPASDQYCISSYAECSGVCHSDKLRISLRRCWCRVIEASRENRIRKRAVRRGGDSGWM